ncbi:serine/threonine-protein kinase [Calothrix sp. PCC 7507]|uniref:serine/threonine-protein kinase n=1 Tax=Calothrix sp. PCC 7507 TaxID=99598 RepID=UPI00029EF450|nr:serine/threonine-protein kinase [Calothrix sp. PCC 7507]AFY33556.1 serine/threonine protein kinase with WD40 repeats [Calothrix sp. PCC 7507]
MRCCLNPDCSNPQNPDDNQYCESCNTPLIPLLRGRYRVIKVLSDEGGFGRTYLAEDVDKLNEWCVVKQFAPKIQETSALKKAIELFKEEAKQLQKLGEHPQIPTLLAYFEQDNYLFLVQQFIDGHNLLQELQQGITYNEAKILDLLLDLLPILQFIHDRGVIHRDIKPQNIIRRQSDGRLVLIDFGSSKQLTATVQTQIGTTIGSHGYTPMEQMQDGEAYPASDLFSLGTTCFHLLTGIRPSKLWMQHGYSWVSAWRQHFSNSGYVGGSLSGHLSQVLDNLLEIDIQQRYQSVDEVIKDLTNQPLLPPTPATLLTVSSTTERLFRKNRLLVYVAILLLGFGGVWYLQSRSQIITNRTQENTPAPSTLKGHASDVNSVAFAPDGITLASGSDDRTIKLWNLATVKQIRTLTGHSRWVWAIAFSPDGKTLASGSADKTIKLWNIATGKEIRTLVGHSQGIASVTFSPDGKTLASGSLDKKIKLWNLATGTEIRTLEGHSQAVAAISFSPDGKTLASGSWDKKIKLWNLATGKEIRTLEGHSGLVLAVAFSPDGINLASGSKDKTIKLWNLVTGEAIRTLKGHTDKVNSVAYLPKSGDNKNQNTILISGSNDNTVKLWNLETGKEIRTLKRDSGYIYSVAVSADGKTIASGGSADNIIKIWRMP